MLQVYIFSIETTTAQRGTVMCKGGRWRHRACKSRLTVRPSNVPGRYNLCMLPLEHFRSERGRIAHN